MPGTVDTLYESNLQSVEVAEAMVVDAAKDVGIDEDESMDLGLAFREAMINAVVHGNNYDTAKKVRIILERRDDAVKITIIDQGAGFDLHKVPDPTQGDNLLRESGRGLLLIQAYVDEFAVKQAAGGGAEVTMVKYAIPD